MPGFQLWREGLEVAERLPDNPIYSPIRWVLLPGWRAAGRSASAAAEPCDHMGRRAAASLLLTCSLWSALNYQINRARGFVTFPTLTPLSPETAGPQGSCHSFSSSPEPHVPRPGEEAAQCSGH